MIPAFPARAPCLAPTDPRRPSPALSTHRFNFQPKCLLPVFVQTLIVAPPTQADMALSALYLHNVNHRAAARPSLGQLSAYNFQVSAISSYDRQWERDFLSHPSIHPPYLQCLLQTGGTNDGRQWKCTLATCWLLAHGRFFKDRIQNWVQRCFSYISIF